LVISHLVNIVSANYFGIGFDRYASVMVPVNLVSLLATLLVLWLVFGRKSPKRYDVDKLSPPHLAIRDPLVLKAAFPILATLLAAYFVTAPLNWPISPITGMAALLLIATAGRWGRPRQQAIISVKLALRHAPWQIVLFSLGMYLVVYGLGHAGLTGYGAATLQWLAQQGHIVATIGTGFLSALVASIMNNLPSTLIGALAIDH